MARSIDNKVVSIKFDNAQFQAKIAETLGALDKLKNNLNFANAQKSFGDLDRAGKNVNLGHLGSAADGVSARFVAMSAVAITALANITNRAVDAGIELAKNLSLVPVMDGFREYETNMNSIQTILANTKSKGSTLDDVNAALQQLNEYSDQTIYNFGEMARNIGTFTAAGVDLDTSVGAIKGIANLAAISGSNSQQASTAMYQLSQAISTGTVRLMDWNSVSNAGLGGEVFKTALFETGKAMGELSDVPMDQTFTEWEDAGNKFRETLQDGWLTSDVLTTTLQAFTGDLSAAQLEQMGYTDDQIVQMQELGRLGVASATEVKTATQLVGTVLEAIGTGWADTFRFVVGDFKEAKALFTSLNNYIGKIVGNFADNRNKIVEGWRNMGGREQLIDSFKAIGRAAQSFIDPLRLAFREIFPRTTVKDLVHLTNRFRVFTEGLKLSGDSMTKVKNIFTGIFSAFAIGWEVLKGIANLFGDIADALAPAGSGVFEFASNMGLAMGNLRQSLVEGGGIREFFSDLGAKIEPAVKSLKNFIDQVKVFVLQAKQLFQSGEGMGRLGDRAGKLQIVFGALATVFRSVVGVLGVVGRVITNVVDFIRPHFERLIAWFQDLGSRLGEALNKGDFSGAFDILNAGVIAGVALALKKVSDAITDFGVSLSSFGGRGTLEYVKTMFFEVGETLKALQLQLKADALMKIAIAMGVLTASMVVLSLIDSAALTKALTAIAAGFGQLTAAMALLSRIDASGFKMGAIAFALIGLSTAVLVLSFAVRSMAKMSWDELARGLTGAGVGIAFLVGAAKGLDGAKGAMIRAAISMGLMSGALLLMSYAVKSFSDLSWDELGRGLAGTAATLAVLVGAMNVMPTSGMIRAATGMLIMSAALKVMVDVVAAFGSMEFEALKQGLGGLALTLAALSLAMNAMPAKGMISAGIGLALIAASLKVMSGVVADFGGMDMEQLALGIGSIAAMLLILAVASNAMSGAILGAIAIGIVSAALVPLANVILVLGQMDMEGVKVAMIALAGALTILGLAALGATYIIPGLIAMSVTLLAVGAGMAMIGFGAAQAANAFSIFAEDGEKGMEFIKEFFNYISTQGPRFAQVLAESIGQLIESLLRMLPGLVEALGVVIESVVDLVTDLAPKWGEMISTLLEEGMNVIRERFPEMIDLGFMLIQNLLSGIDQNIEAITQKITSIIVKMLTVLADNQPQLVAAGVKLLTGFLAALSERIDLIVFAVTKLILSFLQAVTAMVPFIVAAGTEVLLALLFGIAASIDRIIDAVTIIVITLIGELAKSGLAIAGAGADALIAFLAGVTSDMQRVIDAVGIVVVTFIGAVAGLGLLIAGAGADALLAFLEGVAFNIRKVVEGGVDIALALLKGIGSNALRFAEGAADILIDFLNGLADAIREKAPQLREAGRNIASAILSGLTGGLSDKAGDVANTITGVAGDAVDKAREIFGIRSPSRVFAEMGVQIGAGLSQGIDANAAASTRSISNMADQAVGAFRSSIKDMSTKLTGLEDANPTITPVLDLSNVENEASKLSNMMPTPEIDASVSRGQVNDILRAQQEAESAADTEGVGGQGSTELVFNQTINSPRPLDANEVYRKSKNQFALAKEKLRLP